MKLKSYHCTLRHAANIEHTTPKTDVTDREVTLLRRIHGDDAVIDLKLTGEREIADEKHEFFRLARTYTRERVEKEFRVTLDGFEQWLEEQMTAEQQAINDRSDDRQRAYNRDQAEQKRREAEAALRQNAEPAPAQAQPQAAVAVAEGGGARPSME